MFEGLASSWVYRTAQHKHTAGWYRVEVDVPCKKDTLKNSCKSISTNTTAAIALRVVICAPTRLLQVSAGGPFAPASSNGKERR